MLFTRGYCIDSPVDTASLNSIYGECQDRSYRSIPLALFIVLIPTLIIVPVDYVSFALSASLSATIGQIEMPKGAERLSWEAHRKEKQSTKCGHPITRGREKSSHGISDTEYRLRVMQREVMLHFLAHSIEGLLLSARHEGE